MIVEQVRPLTFRLTVRGFELAALIAAARCVAEGRESALSDEAKRQLDQLLAAYDRSTRNRTQPDAGRTSSRVQ